MAGVPTTCPYCGEPNPGEAAVCPRCGLGFMQQDSDDDLARTLPFAPAMDPPPPGAVDSAQPHTPAPQGPDLARTSVERPAVEPRDTVPSVPALDQPIVESSNPGTLQDGDVVDNLLATVVDSEHGAGGGGNLNDTVVDVKAYDPDPERPITFGEVAVDEEGLNTTGKRPLDYREFHRGGEVSATGPGSGRQLAVSTRPPDLGTPPGGAAVSGVAEVLEAAPSDAPVEASPDAGGVQDRVRAVRRGGLAWLARVLMVVTILLWLGYGGLAAAGYFVFMPVLELVAALPVHPDLLGAGPGLLTLLCLLLVGIVTARGDSVLAPRSAAGAFFKLLLLLVLVLLPGVGLIVALVYGLRLVFRRRYPLAPRPAPEGEPAQLRRRYDLAGMSRLTGLLLLAVSLAAHATTAVRIHPLVMRML